MNYIFHTSKQNLKVLQNMDSTSFNSFLLVDKNKIREMSLKSTETVNLSLQIIWFLLKRVFILNNDYAL